MKKEKQFFLSFQSNSRRSRRPQTTKRFQARLSRKKETFLKHFLLASSLFVLKAGRVLAYCVLLLPVLIAAEETYHIFLTMEDFQVREIQIDGNYFLSLEQIRDKAGITEGESLITADLGEMAQRIRELTVVKDVKIKKRFPGHLAIVITERDPVFLSSERHYLLDEAGVKLPFSPDGFSVPAITGFHYDRRGNIDSKQIKLYAKSVEALRRFYEMAGVIPEKINSIRVRKGRYYLIDFQNEMQVKLPVAFDDEHFHRLVCVYNDLSRKNIPFQTIDLTFQHVVVKKKKQTKKL